MRVGLTVVADCVNASAVSQATWTEVAAEASHPHLYVEVVCSDEKEHRRRVESRVPDISGHVLPSWEAVQALSIEPFAGECLSIDTARVSVEAAVELIVASVRPVTRAGDARGGAS
jgi:hypothetical protein